jgi:hypothetical protein
VPGSSPGEFSAISERSAQELSVASCQFLVLFLVPHICPLLADVGVCHSMFGAKLLTTDFFANWQLATGNFFPSRPASSSSR